MPRLIQPLFIALFFLSLVLPRLGNAQCPCTNCPVAIPDETTTSFSVVVAGATNNTLGTAGQALCGVRLHFSHQYVSDLSITLTSPGGTSVNLVGPVDLGNNTSGTTWDINFVPCAQTPAPDPTFPNSFQTTAAWGIAGAYDGTYHPYTGCLEDFNSGPVNGAWVMEILDYEDRDTGILLGFELVFCDATGINCTVCEAAAGNLTQPDVLSCLNHPSLNLSLPPAYVSGTVAPPAADYSYSYIISTNSGVILEYQTVPNLTAFPLGTYNICGFSYRTAQSPLIPPPNGVRTTAQLRTLLNSPMPPFCGDVSDNCVTVTIAPVPQDTYDTTTVCEGQCVLFQGNLYCVEGDYAIPANAGLCTYTRNLSLRVNPVLRDTIYETICQGNCATSPGFNPAPCAAGNYSRPIPNPNGCDGFQVLVLSVISANPVISPVTDTFSCAQTAILLNGSSSTAGGNISYSWTTTDGTLTVPTNQANATATRRGTYTLQVCGEQNGVTCCQSSSITLGGSNNVPATPTIITGLDTLCVGSTVTFSTPLVPSATSYFWQVPVGVTIVSGQNSPSLTVSWDVTTSGQVCVSAINACGGSAFFCKNIRVLSVPLQPNLSGGTLLCEGSLANYFAQTPDILATLNFTVTGGNLTQSSQFPGVASGSVAFPTPSAPFTQVCVNASNRCGVSPDTCLEISFINPPQPGMIGPSEVCAGDTVTYFNNPSSANLNYTWDVVGNHTLIERVDTAFIRLIWTGGTANICLRPANSCGSGLDSCLVVTVHPKPQPNAGPNRSICGLSTALQGSVLLPGQTGNWFLVNGMGGTAVFDTPNSPTSMLTVNQSGVYRLGWAVTGVGGCADTSFVNLTFTDGVTLGVIEELCVSTNDSFFVQIPILGGTAPYRVNGVPIIGSVFTSNTIESGQAYSYIITDANGCTSQLIQGEHNCACTSDAGTMQQTLLTACANETVTATANPDFTLDSDDVVGYILHDGSGPALGTVYIINDTGVFSADNGVLLGQTYYISRVVATNDGTGVPYFSDLCLSVSAGQPVIFYPTPPSSGSPDRELCGFSATLTAAAPLTGGSGQWTLVLASPGSAVVTISAPQNPITQVTTNEPGFFRFEWRNSIGNCSTRDTFSLRFNPPPRIEAVVEVCNAVNDSFLVQFSVLGGTSNFSVNGLPIVGNSFESAYFLSGSSYQFVVEDQEGCRSDTLRGDHACQCLSNAGTMSTTPLSACVDGTVTAVANPNAVFDPNDVAGFVLHDGNSTTLGTVFAQNNTGVFGFENGMTPGQTYYISRVAATDDGTGAPDLDDDCLSVAQGQSVVFHPFPLADAGADADTCGFSFGLNALLGANPATGIWSVLENPLGATAFFSQNSNPNASFTADQAGTYTLEWETSANGCSARDTLNLTLFPKPNIVNATESCTPANDSFFVQFTVVGGTPNFAANGVVFLGNAFQSGLFESGNTYTIVVNDANGCATDTLRGQENCLCTTDAGTMSATPLTACVDGTVTAAANSDATLDPNDVTVFVLHSNNGTTLGTVFAQNNTGVFAFENGMTPGQTYYISRVVASDDGTGAPDLTEGCLSVATGQAVVFHPFPLADAGADADTCGFSLGLNALLGANPDMGIWSVLENPLGATAFFSQNTNPNAAFTADQAGTYTLEWETSANGCSARDTLNLTLFPKPSIANATESCTPANDSFFVQFTVVGGTPNFAANGVVFLGNAFQLGLFESGNAYTIVVNDANGCATDTLRGQQNCLCTTDAGTMSATPLTACVDGTVTAAANSDATLDPNDVTVFVLHSGNGTTLGTVFAQNNTGVFTFENGMTPGQTYYISRVVASDDGTGAPDLTEGCLSVATGQAVVFQALPTLSWQFEPVLCGLDSVELTLNATGTFPIEVSIFQENGAISSVFSINQAQTTLSVPTPQSTEIWVTQVRETNTNGCTAAILPDTLSILVGTPALPTTFSSPFSVCNNPLFGSSLDFSSLILSGDRTGVWRNPENVGTGSLPMLDFAGVSPGTYRFTYTTATSSIPCVDSTYTILVRVDDCLCPPINLNPPTTLCDRGAPELLNTWFLGAAPAGNWQIIGTPPGTNPARIQNGAFVAQSADLGRYSISFLLENTPPLGCPDGDTIFVDLIRGLSAGTPVPDVYFCAGTDSIFSLINALSVAHDMGIWSSTDAPSSAFDATNGTFSIRDLVVGTYNFAYSVLGNAPCPNDTARIEVRIVPNPSATASPTLATLTCADQSVALTGSGTPSSSGAGLNYQWFFQNQAVSNGNQAQITATEAGIYTFQVREQVTGCRATDSVEVVLDSDLPKAELVTIQPNCTNPGGGSIQISQLLGGMSPYLAAINGGAFSSLMSFENLAPGDYSVIVQDADGCTWESPVVTIEANNEFSIQFSDSILVAHLGDLTTITALSNPPDALLDTLVWSFLSDTTAAQSLQQEFIALQTRRYSLTAIDQNGCSATASILLRVENDRRVYLPNVFRYDDSQNGFLTVYAGTEVLEIEQFQIYDRWGERVFSTQNIAPNVPNLGWNGIFNEKPALPGVYVARARLLFVDGKREEMAWDVVLVR